MPELKKAKKVEPLSEKEEAAAGMYKGYDVEWLRGELRHPDYKLVAEYDKKYGKKEK